MQAVPLFDSTEMAGQLTTAERAVAFMLAGNATFTIRSRATGTRFTYKVKLAKKNLATDTDLWFVSLLNGPDNQSDFCYMGVIRDRSFRFTTKSTVRPEAASAKAFVWLHTHLVMGTLPASVEVWHEGSCGRCGRKLTVPESVAAGIGPECASKME